MTGDFSFLYRVALLLGLMLAVSLVDVCKNGAQGVKYREYGFVLITGLLGLAVGFTNDLITSSISPDYFILGKGLEEGGDLRWQAGLYGMRVGFSAGVIGGAVCLYVTQKKSAYPPAKFSSLLRKLWMPLVGAIAGGIAVPLVFSRFDPARFSAQLESMISAEKIDRFRQVWWTHVGIYAGMIIGLTVMLIQTVKQRRALPIKT